MERHEIVPTIMEYFKNTRRDGVKYKRCYIMFSTNSMTIYVRNFWGRCLSNFSIDYTDIEEIILNSACLHIPFTGGVYSVYFK